MNKIIDPVVNNIDGWMDQSISQWIYCNEKQQ